jgi:hypothetical protein
MALRMPVLEIPLDSAAFDKFARTFSAYQGDLEKNPALWRKTSEAIFGGGAALKQLSTAGRPVENLWRNVAHASGTVLGNTLKITGQLLKWSTIIGGGLLGGSLFGITRLASDTANYRRAAMGLGMSIGGYRSFGVNFGRLGDPGGFLSAINQMVSNPALQGPLYSLGVDPNGSTSQVAVATLKAMRQLAKSVPRGELGLYSQAYGLGPLGGLTKLMLLKAMGNKEFASLLAGNSADKSALGISPKTALAWQNFTTQLHRAGGEIFTVFVRGLAPLEKPLANLSTAFAGFLTRLMSGPLLKHGIDKLADFLNKFSVDVESKRFQNAVSSLVSDTGTIARALHVLAHELGFLLPRNSAHAGIIKTGSELPLSYRLMHPGGLAPMLGLNKGSYTSYLSATDRYFGLPAGTLERLWKREASDRFNPPISSAGAVGPMQLMPGTARAMGVDPSDPESAGYGAGLYLSQLVKRYHGNMQAALAAYNWGGANVDRLVSRYGAGWRGHLPKGVNSYVTATSPDPHISVTVKSKTGASAVLAGAGLAAMPGT